MLIAAFIGIVLGVLTIVLARVIRGQWWVFSLGLLALPSLYAMFALGAGELAVGVKEMIYGVPFLVVGVVFTFVSARWSAVVVGALWILHGVYDVTHHLFFANAGVPGWYPAFCFWVDVVIGGYVWWLAGRISMGDLRRA